MSTAFLHGRIGTAMVLFTAVAAVYGLIEYWRKKPLSDSYWGVIVIGNLLAVLQAAVGAWMALGGAQPGRGAIHFVYGVVALLWVPIIVLFNRNRSGRAETLVCALVSLFEFGIALRALTTGG